MLRVMLVLCGFGLGMALGDTWGALFGVLAGLGLATLIGRADDKADLATLQRRLEKLEHEVSRLRQTVAADAPPSAIASPQPVTSGLSQSAAPSAPTPAIATPPTRHRPPAKAAPASPISATLGNLLAQASQTVREWLFGGNTVVRVGLLILFFGVAFLLKFAADNRLLPIELRLAGLALGAIALLATGWRLRHASLHYGLLLQGGGIGVLYLTTFGAFHLYALLPAAFALALLVTIVVLSAALAILQEARPLAVMGILGGFLAPILTANGHGNHVMLFSYYALLNAGIFGIAWHKAWRSLNLLGFLFTFGIGSSWGVMNYHAALFASTEPFLLLFFLFYFGIGALYAIRQGCEIRHPIDGTLVFGTPLAAFGLQAAMLQGMPLAWSAVALALFYLLTTRFLVHLPALLRESYVVLGLVFATMAVPLAFDGRVTSAIWALEGAGALWLGLRQQRRLAIWSGIALQLLAGAGFALTPPQTISMPFANSEFAGTIMLALAGLASSQQLHRHGQHGGHRQASWLLAIWGLLWWLGGSLQQIEHWQTLTAAMTSNAHLLLMLGSAPLLAWAGARCSWPQAQRLASLLPALLILQAGADAIALAHPFAAWCWPLALAGNLALLHRFGDTSRIDQTMHLLSFWLVAALLGLECHWLADHHRTLGIWLDSLWIYIYTVIPLVMIRLQQRWPVLRYPQIYLQQGPAPLVLLVWLWGFYAATQAGDPAPLPFIPILNPLDLTQLLAFGGMAHWLRLQTQRGWPLPRQILWLAGGAAVFFWLNAALLRSLHFLLQVPYTADALAHSILVQMALSLFWSLLALALMFAAVRRVGRSLWISGAILLGIVVGKLFLVDLSGTGSVERIASFLGVGLLLLLIGYVAPLPPHKKEPQP